VTASLNSAAKAGYSPFASPGTSTSRLSIVRISSAETRTGQEGLSRVAQVLLTIYKREGRWTPVACVQQFEGARCSKPERRISMAKDSCTVVVIDDEPGILSVVCEVLEDDGYNVVCLSHPQMAEDLDGASTKLFILDMMMPGLSGIALAEQLRHHGFAWTPMIAMSASSAMLRAAEASRLFQGTLPKPFELTRLLDFAERFAS
jgi:CheY-like chemotaxis protein